jgi:hypothetical protein
MKRTLMLRKPCANVFPCKLKAVIVLNERTFKAEEVWSYKVSAYPLVNGDRYLVFYQNYFQAGFSPQEFEKYFEVINGNLN